MRRLIVWISNFTADCATFAVFFLFYAMLVVLRRLHDRPQGDWGKKEKS